eukprot:gene1448-1825_t
MSALLFNNNLFDLLNNQNIQYKFQPSSPSKKYKPQKHVYTPSLDISETSDSFLIDLEFPGVSKEDISIDFLESKLVVEANKPKSKRFYNNNKKESDSKQQVPEEKPTLEEINDSEFDNQSTCSSSSSSKQSTESPKKEETKQDELAKEIVSERRFGKLKRVIDLSSHLNMIDIGSIKATHNNGVLEITIPKKEAPKPLKISIL